MNYLKLGASLYVPAIHEHISLIARGVKFKNLKSVIIDTEDAITTDDMPYAYKNISKMLLDLKENDNKETPLIFIRVRNYNELKKISDFDNIEQITGFVLPKFTQENMSEYMDDYRKDKLYMPILEKDIFNLDNIKEIRNFLLEYKNNILSVRIGATDILSSLNMRRSNLNTIYEIGLMSQIISNIVITFKPYGFNITGPVWECFSETSNNLLQKEVSLDLLNGLFGKSIIHPSHIDIVQEIYKVSSEDFEISKKIVSDDVPAVFKAYEKMNEKATHLNWAKTILSRAEIYGIKENL